MRPRSGVPLRHGPCECPCSLRITAAEVRSLAVAVRAEKLKIHEPVVVAVSVHVVERHRERLPTPLGDAADLATKLLETAGKQAHLEVVAVDPAPLHQVLVDRSGGGPGTGEVRLAPRDARSLCRTRTPVHTPLSSAPRRNGFGSSTSHIDVRTSRQGPCPAAVRGSRPSTSRRPSRPRCRRWSFRARASWRPAHA